MREKIDIRQINDVDLAWLAGLLEGEGAFMVHHDPATETRRARVVIRIAVHMTDRDVVGRVRNIVGLGTVLRKPPGKPHHKETFRWAISAKAPTLKLMQVLRPHMGERRTVQIDKCLQAVAADGGIHVRSRNHGETLYRDGCRCEVCCNAKLSANARRYTKPADVA